MFVGRPAYSPTKQSLAEVIHCDNARQDSEKRITIPRLPVIHYSNCLISSNTPGEREEVAVCEISVAPVLRMRRQSTLLVAVQISCDRP